MGVNLVKGQKVSLTKDNPNLKKIMVGLGWDPNASCTGNFDCDASVILLGNDGKVVADKVVYFGHKTGDNGSVKHMGDNLTGAGDGDDEQIFVDLGAISQDIEKLVFTVNIYNCRGKHFGMINNAFIRVIDYNQNAELIRFNLTEDYSGKTALIVGELYRHNGEWKFNSLGQGTEDISITQLAERYR